MRIKAPISINSGPFGIIGGFFFTTILIATSLFVHSLVGPRSGWVSVPGTIIGTSASKNNSGSSSPIVQFNVGDQEYTAESKLNTNANYRIGATQNVFYNPEDPNESRVDQGLWAAGVVWLFAGGGVLSGTTATISLIRLLKD